MQNPIIVVDDDADDLEMFGMAYDSLNLPNTLLRFASVDSLINYLMSTTDIPLLIFSDYNMPKMNGVELKRFMASHSRLSSIHIPFVIWSTTFNQAQIEGAYNASVQGYFEKPADFTLLTQKIANIITYWKNSLFHRTI